MGRVPDEDRSDKITISHLWPHHRAMVRYAAAGKKPADIAAIFGMSLPQTSVIMNSPLFVAELNRLIKEMEMAIPDAAADLRTLVPRAVEVLSEELHAGDQGSSLRTRVAFGVLEGVGHLKKGGEVHIGDKEIHFHSYTPRPGEDPEEVEGKLLEHRDEIIDMEEDNGV